jgi:FdhE protein
VTGEPLAELEREHPEWRAWLRLLAAARGAIGDGTWSAAVPDEPPASRPPLIDGATFALGRRAAGGWVRGLLTTAAGAGAAPSLGEAARSRALDALAFLEAAVAGDRERLAAIAKATGAETEPLASVAAVAAMPLLQACGRRWSARVDPAWEGAHCPVCGAWPALAEARGLEGERRLRCARCGGDWRTQWLRCPFCGNGDHLRLGALVPEGTTDTRKVDTCALCRRHVKTLTTLAATPPADVALADLTTVDLDVAALAHGYEPPAGLGAPVRVRVVARRWSARPAWIG